MVYDGEETAAAVMKPSWCVCIMKRYDICPGNKCWKHYKGGRGDVPMSLEMVLFLCITIFFPGYLVNCLMVKLQRIEINDLGFNKKGKNK